MPEDVIGHARLCDTLDIAIAIGEPLRTRKSTPLRSKARPTRTASPRLYRQTPSTIRRHSSPTAARSSSISVVSSRAPKPRRALMPRLVSAQPRASSRRSGCGPPRRHARGHQARPPRAISSPTRATSQTTSPHRCPLAGVQHGVDVGQRHTQDVVLGGHHLEKPSGAIGCTVQDEPRAGGHEFQEGHPPMFEPHTTSCSTRAPAPVVPRPCVHVQESFPPLGPLRTVRWSRADLSPDSSCRLSPLADDAKPRKSTLWADARTYWLSRRSPQDHHQIHRCPDHGPASGLARSSSAATETLSNSADREATHRTACWTRCRGGGTM